MVEVWQSTDQVQIVLREGVLVGTKGLGGDMRSAQAQTVIAALDVAGNPSAIHAEGRAARAIVERADYNRLWGAFAFCLRQRYLLLAAKLLIKIVLKNPVRTISDLGRSARAMLPGVLYGCLVDRAFFYC